jgi:hypothetical protein
MRSAESMARTSSAGWQGARIWAPVNPVVELNLGAARIVAGATFGWVGSSSSCNWCSRLHPQRPGRHVSPKWGSCKRCSVVRFRPRLMAARRTSRSIGLPKRRHVLSCAPHLPICSRQAFRRPTEAKNTIAPKGLSALVTRPALTQQILPKRRDRT